MTISEWIDATGIDPWRAFSYEEVLTPKEYCRVQGYDCSNPATVDMYLDYLGKKVPHEITFIFKVERCIPMTGGASEISIIERKHKNIDGARIMAIKNDWEFIGYKMP